MANNTYLDETGLAHLWEKIKSSATSIASSIFNTKIHNAISVTEGDILNAAEESSGHYYNVTYTDPTTSTTKTAVSGVLNTYDSNTADKQIYPYRAAYVDTLMAQASIKSVYYGTCSTAANDPVKEITISYAFSEMDNIPKGTILVINFTNTNTATNPSFYFENPGTYSIKYNNSIITTTNLGYAGTANRPSVYICDGTDLVWIGWSYTQTFSAMTQNEADTGTATTSRVITAKVLDTKIDNVVSNAITVTNEAIENALGEQSGRKYSVVYTDPSSGTSTTALSGVLYTYESNSADKQTYPYRAAYIDNLETTLKSMINSITSISYSIVQTLPSTGKEGVIYLVAHTHGTKDVYDEYIWTGSDFEKIGNTDIDLSNYVQKGDYTPITNATIDTICV